MNRPLFTSTTEQDKINLHWAIARSAIALALHIAGKATPDDAYTLADFFLGQFSKDVEQGPPEPKA